MDPTFDRARRYVSEVQAMIAGQTYEEFKHALTEYRRMKVDSSFVISTVKRLFREQYPQLLEGFKAFMPSDAAVEEEEEAEDRRKRSSVDFLNRVKARLGVRAYLKLLERMQERAREEIGGADLFDEVVGLLRGDGDLVAEFTSFLPESFPGERSRKRKRADRDGDGGDSEQWKRGAKDRVSDPDRPAARRLMTGEQKKKEAKDRVSDPDSPAARRTSQRLMMEEQKEAIKVAERDFRMEDELCAVEVRDSSLENCIERAMLLSDRLSRGLLSPADVRLEPHFTPLTLACIKTFHPKFLEDANLDLVRALPKLIAVLNNKKKASEIARLKIIQKWRLLRNPDS